MTFIDWVVNGSSEAVTDGKVPPFAPKACQGLGNKGVVEMRSNPQANHAGHGGGWPIHGNP